MTVLNIFQFGFAIIAASMAVSSFLKAGRLSSEGKTEWAIDCLALGIFLASTAIGISADAAQ